MWEELLSTSTRGAWWLLNFWIMNIFLASSLWSYSWIILHLTLNSRSSSTCPQTCLRIRSRTFFKCAKLTSQLGTRRISPPIRFNIHLTHCLKRASTTSWRSRKWNLLWRHFLPLSITWTLNLGNKSSSPSRSTHWVNIWDLMLPRLRRLMFSRKIQTVFLVRLDQSLECLISAEHLLERGSLRSG